jgi:hypothetical protein
MLVRLPNCARSGYIFHVSYHLSPGLLVEAERGIGSLYTIYTVHKACDSKLFSLHCKRRADEIQYKCLVPVYVFPEMKQNFNFLSPNFHINVFVSNLYIPRIRSLNVGSGTIDRAVSFLGIHKSDIWYSAVLQCGLIM